MHGRATMLSFAAVGAMGAIATAMVFSLSLTIIIVPPTVVLCALLGYLVGRLRYGWAVTIPLVPVAGMVNGAVLAGVIEPSHLGEAVQLGAICSVPFLLVLPFVALVASRAKARPRSLARRLERAQLVATTLAACAALLAIPFQTNAHTLFSPQDSPPAVVVGLLVLLLVIAVATFVRALCGSLRAHEAVRAVPLLRSSEPVGPSEQRDSTYLDLGLGATQHVYVDPQTLLRAVPTARVVYDGDARRVARLGSVAVGLATAALASTLGLVIAAVVRFT